MLHDKVRVGNALGSHGRGGEHHALQGEQRQGFGQGGVRGSRVTQAKGMHSGMASVQSSTRAG